MPGGKRLVSKLLIVSGMYQTVSDPKEIIVGTMNGEKVVDILRETESAATTRPSP